MRGHRVEDFEACAAMWADPKVTLHISGRPFTGEETWTRLLRFVGHWQLLGFGYWAVEEKATGVFAGEVGFADYKRDLDPALSGKPEIGWVFASRFHRKGYATEAVQAAIAWGDEHFGAAETFCIIHPGNVASIRVAEKCGYRESQITEYKGQSVIVLNR